MTSAATLTFSKKKKFLMKKNSIFVFGICAAMLFTGCKSRESAYRQAYEQAMAQDNKTSQNEQQAQGVVENNDNQEVVTTTVVPVTPINNTVETVDHSDVREIQGELSVIRVRRPTR